jgi:hypothetical protein
MVSHIKQFLFLGLSWDYYYTTLVIYVEAESVLSVFSNKNLDESTSEVHQHNWATPLPAD